MGPMAKQSSSLFTPPPTSLVHSPATTLEALGASQLSSRLYQGLGAAKL